MLTLGSLSSTFVLLSERNLCGTFVRLMRGYVEHAQPDFKLSVRCDGRVFILQALTVNARRWCEEACGVKDASEPEFRLNIFEHAIERYLSAINAAGLRVGDDVCVGGDGTAKLTGSISNVCVRPN